MFVASSKSRYSPNSEHIKIKIKMPNPSQDSPAPTIAPNQDLKDIDVLYTFKIKIESQNSEYGCIKDQWPYPNEDQDAESQSGTFSILQRSISGLIGHGWSLHLEMRITIQNLEYGCIKDQWPYPNQDQDAKPKSETSSIPKRTKSGL